MHIRNALALSLFGLIGICQSQSIRAQEADDSALDEGAPIPAPVALEAPGARELQEAMRRIAVRPTDADALADAGNASLLLGDPNAALNFFTRANTLQPASGRIKAGLAAATVRTENPFEALRLFDDAIRLGISERAIAADRALAFDLLGNFDRAQLDYKLASTAFVSDNLIIQQAISLSLLGRKEEADGMLVPLLQKENPSAWRARAFMLAARGELGESERVAQSFLDQASARRVERYLRLMPQLTNAQQAAAIHLGHFPANNIGRDSDAVRTVAATIPPVPTTGPGRLIPSGAPLGTKAAKGKPVKETSQARKEREKAEKLAAAAATKRGAVLTSVNTAAAVSPPNAVAKARIEEAARASVTLTAMRDLPPPDTARPLVKVALPPQAENQPPVAQQTAPTVAVAPTPLSTPTPTPIPAPAVTPAPVQIAQQASAPPPSPSPIRSPVVAQPQQTVPLPQSQPLPQTQPVIAATIPPLPPQPFLTPAPISTPAPTPAPVIAALPDAPKVIPEVVATPTPVVVQQILPAPLPVTTPPPAAASTAVAVTGPAPDAPVVPAIQQGPVPDGTIVKDAPEIVPVSDAPPAVAKVEDVPAPTPAAPAPPKPFDLGSIVNAIEIPASEQKRTTAAVDLKKLKPAVPKQTPEEAKAAAAKAKPVTKTPANPERYWAQIATGDKAGLGFDYKSWVRKKPDLFKGHSGWTSPWGKSSRLLVGPFDDMKAAKKWESDFRKAGGDGFAWKSEAGVVVEPVKGK